MALIAKADLENELQTTLGDYDIDGICAWAEATLKQRTNRSSFSGNTASIAKFAAICLAIDRLSMTDPNIGAASNIDSISEGGASITFASGRTLSSYKEEAKTLIAELKLQSTPSYGLTFADPSDEHTGDEGSILY